MVLTGAATAFAVGRSAAWCRFVERATRVAPLERHGPDPGRDRAGKEIVARLIVALGRRTEAPFVVVNCAALPDTLVESELFGHARGSFSGATEARRGLFEEAHRGTLFLDEIGALPLPAQAKLLRVLEEGHVRRVGREPDDTGRREGPRGDEPSISRRPSPGASSGRTSTSASRPSSSSCPRCGSGPRTSRSSSRTSSERLEEQGGPAGRSPRRRSTS